MIGTQQMQVMGEFYQKVFDKAPDMDDPQGKGWMVGAGFFSLGEHSEVHGSNNDPSRIILNFETAEVQAEFDRIKALGATVIKEPYDMGNNMWVATLADPDGNYFQVMSPWDDNQ
jgi:predicted enzyme related to lactoylglutathione lyase